MLSILIKVLAANLGESYTSYQSYYLKCASGAQSVSEALTNCIVAVQKFLINFALIITPLSLVISGFLAIIFSTQPSKMKIVKDIIQYTLIGLGIILGAEIILQIIKYIFGV